MNRCVFDLRFESLFAPFTGDPDVRVFLISLKVKPIVWALSLPPLLPPPLSPPPPLPPSPPPSHIPTHSSPLRSLRPIIQHLSLIEKEAPYPHPFSRSRLRPHTLHFSPTSGRAGRRTKTSSHPRLSHLLFAVPPSHSLPDSGDGYLSIRTISSSQAGTGVVSPPPPVILSPPTSSHCFHFLPSFLPSFFFSHYLAQAGGVALNLTVASAVYIMDPWWNPAVEFQAGRHTAHNDTIRIHRILGCSIHKKEGIS